MQTAGPDPVLRLLVLPRRPAAMRLDETALADNRPRHWRSHISLRVRDSSMCSSRVGSAEPPPLARTHRHCQRAAWLPRKSSARCSEQRPGRTWQSTQSEQQWRFVSFRLCQSEVTFEVHAAVHSDILSDYTTFSE